MLLPRLASDAGAREAGAEACRAIAEMYPLCRSITGDGVRRTLDIVERIVPLDRHEVPTGTAAFDWQVPREWNIREAWIADRTGHRVVDFRAHNLHVVGYSVPLHRTMSLEELQPHLHSLPEYPDWIPYRTTYYREDWGFCLRHRDRERLGTGPYEVMIDADLAPGHLTYAECVVAGSGPGIGLVYTHTCHPSLVNDNLSGIAGAALLAREVRASRPRLTWRIVFGPGTIGSLVWLSRNESLLERIAGGLVVGLLGDDAALTYKRSRSSVSATDRAAEHVLAGASASYRVTDFEPYGYDERQFCSPAIDLPIGRITRSTNAGYPQYHTSADDLSVVRPEQLAGSLQALARIVSAIDCNRRLVNLSGKGEPQLGRRGLYGATGGKNTPAQFEIALLWVLSLADGAHDLVAMAKQSGLAIELVDQAAEALEKAGLVATVPEPAHVPALRATLQSAHVGDAGR